ncbi:hypothetical protein [Saccharothrix variisporea]|uniref:DNA-binding protein n=1 Tax=Saccharothrix variisporea TaxID=543527 RepID=A0A495X2M6_9PSEU|nr:hypothetical protein [Saccharothrix variisporea]RKT68137.1 hypothetical protein DFJ66_1318 [Saccharothrix variisporea]
MSTEKALIAAGAVLPGVGAAGEDRDTITARHYAHPALGDRVVVRLVPEVLGRAEDLTCEFLGFAEPARVAEVGTGRRSALGFPAWALVNDPRNAHHALNLVKEVERLARVAKSRAGAAKDGFTALGDMLGRSAPHFLPTFYEQAGRIFVQHGNQTYAATMFGKAREAEEVHDLAVDPERTREVFLEFAFAGALTAKALSAHAKGLARKHDADAAYELFLTLCVERTKGGLPPYTGMPEDLRRLAKAAKRDLRAEDERLLRAVLESTAVSRATASFWKSYRDSLVGLAKADGEIRAQLLTFVPASASTVDTWLEILTACGATRELVEPGGNADAAEWLSSLLGVRSSGWREHGRSQALLDLVEAMADRLAAEGKPVRALRGWRQGELDLLDLMVSRGVPIEKADRDDHELYVQGWLADDEPGRRDLAALAASERFVTGLGDGLVSYLRNVRQKSAVATEVLVAVLSVPGLRAALRHWISRRAGQSALGLPALGRHLENLAVVALPEAFADIPEAAEALAATDVGAALHATLRAGLLDELGWPALEEAVAKLRGSGAVKGEDVVVCGEGWPALVLRRGEDFIVVGPDGILFEHVSRIPADDRHSWAFAPTGSWFDGVLLVTWHGVDGERAYWSDAPDHIFDPATGGSVYYGRQSAPHASIALPDGSRFTGQRAAKPGDTKLPGLDRAHGDGTSLWTGAWVEHTFRWLEVDPATGDRGRASLPRFLEDFAEDGTSLVPADCDLRPAVAATAASPLGVANGLHGWRVRKEADGSSVGEGVDGVRVRVAPGRSRPLGSLRLPAGGRLDLIGGNHDSVALHDVHGVELGDVKSEASLQRFAAGTPLVPPLDWWHVLKPRDEAGSAALRAVSREAVDAMIAAALDAPDARSRSERLAAFAGGDHDHEVVRAVRRHLPGLTHPGLLAGVVELVRRAADLLVRYRRYGEIAARARQVDTSVFAPRGPVVTEDAMRAALSWFDSTSGSSGTVETRAPQQIAELAAVAATAAGGTAGRELGEHSPTWWWLWLPDLAALAHRAASPLTPPEHRDALTVLLGAIADHGLADAPGHWRLVSAAVPEGQANPKHRVTPVEGGFVAVFQEQWIYNGDNRYDGIQYAVTPGRFELPRGWRLDTAREVDTPFGSERIRRFLAVLAERGPAPWFPAAVAEFAERTGVGTAEATVLLAGMPGVDTWQSTYLSTAERKLLDLSAAGAKTAKERLRPLDDGFRRRLLAAAVPADPADLWTSGPDVEAVAAVWIAEKGVRRPVPDDVLADAVKLPVRSGGEYVTGVVNPETTPWLTLDRDARLDGGSVVAREPGGFGVAELHSVPEVLAWLAYRLPAASPLRSALPVALDLVRQRVAHPGFLIELNSWIESKSLHNLLGVAEAPEGEVLQARPWLSVIRSNDHYSKAVVHVSLVGPGDRAELAALAEISYANHLVAALDVLGEASLAAACSARADTDPDVYFQDPTVSVPGLVAEVAAKTGLPEDAAVLYLQLLALPDPTDANVARWTGWKPARLRGAREALAATDLVLTAKRSRAGRSLFLPGGWLALGSPHLPLESWKAPMFGFTTEPAGVIVPREPVADLFARAWRRVLDGDAPAYEELKTGGRR